MNGSNPYAPPSARVEDVRVYAADDDIPFFAVSVRKLVLMSLCTFGLYQVYWFYKNWRRVQERGEHNIMPVMRAIFGIFFCYAFFKRVRDYEHPNVSSASLPAGPLALVWIILQFSASWPKAPTILSLLTTISVFCLVPVQVRINQINGDVAPDHDPNGTFKGWNWFGLIFGGLMFVMAILGSLMPEA